MAARLLILSPTPARGGAEEYLLTIAEAAIERGWTVTVSLEVSPRTRSIADQLRSQTEASVLDAPIRGGRRWGITGQIVATSRVLLRARPDVTMIVLPGPTLGIGCIIAAALGAVPAAVVFQLAPRALSLGRWALCCRLARRRHQRWIAVSAQNADAVRRSFDLDPGNVETIYNGGPDQVMTSPEEQSAARRALRTELQLPPDARVALTVGRLDVQKGHGDLLAALPQVLEDHRDVCFVWVGDGDLRPELESQIRAGGLEQHVRILGHRGDVDRLLEAADLFLLPSHFEGLPFALLEAMAHGVPVVCSDAGGSPEIVRDGIDGLVHRREDADHLRDRLTWALDHPQPMREMAESSRARVASFSRTRMLTDTFGVLDDLRG